MYIANLQHDKFSLRMELHNTQEAFANMLRRSLTNVPCPAASSVTFFENESAFPDEVLAHRFGQLPLRVNVNNNAKPQERNQADGTPTTSTVTLRPLVVNAVGPCVVRASALVPDPNAVEEKRSDAATSEDCRMDLMDVRVACLHDNDPLLVVLGEDERLRCRLNITYNRSKAHARHSSSVAATVIRRHDGMQFKDRKKRIRPSLHEKVPSECFCPTVKWGETCPDCNCPVRPLDLRNAPEVFILQFETSGTYDPIELMLASLYETVCATNVVLRQMYEHVDDDQEKSVCGRDKANA